MIETQYTYLLSEKMQIKTVHSFLKFITIKLDNIIKLT